MNTSFQSQTISKTVLLDDHDHSNHTKTQSKQSNLQLAWKRFTTIMSHYKKNASSNRDALFGSSGSSNKKDRPSRNKPTSTSNTSSATATTASKSKGYSYSSNKPKASSNISKPSSSLSQEAQIAKRKEAELNRDKGNACLKTGLFKSPDFVAATTFFKRAADAYKSLGDKKLEKLYRLETARCNTVTTAWASAADDYQRAAHLAEAPREASEYYAKASHCWTELGERTKAAACQVQAATVLVHQVLDHDSLTALETAIEAHVPDPLNDYATFRQSGTSQFIDPDNDNETILNVSAATLELAQQHLVTKSYAHEPVQAIVGLLCEHGHYASALYAAGAVTKILQSDGVSTLSLSRAYCVESILALAIGDSVLAEQRFLNVHVQSDAYLKSRECALAEDLIKAVKHRNGDELEEVRDTAGPHRAALNNLDQGVRKVVFELRVSGVARPKQQEGGEHEHQAPKHPDMPLGELLAKSTGYEVEENLDGEALDAELDALDLSNTNDDEDLSDDDDIDLR